MIRHLTWTVIVLSAAASAILLPPAARAVETVRLDAAGEARAGIEIRPVIEVSFGDQIRIVGQTVRSPGATLRVKALVEGRVDAVHVAPGDRVPRGGALVTIESHDLHELKGRYLRAREALKLAENHVEAGEQLLELEGISRLNLEQRRQHALGARLDIAAVEAELEHLGFRRQEVATLFDDPDWHPKLTLRAPMAGAVLDLEVEAHGWVERYQPLLVLGDPARLELELQMPPDQADRAAPGDIVEFVPVGRPRIAGRARIITRVPRVDPTTRTVTLRAEITEGRALTLPGVFIEGTLVRGEASASPSVPESAVIRIGAEDRVFVHTGESTYEARPVDVGRFNGSRYEILAGAAVGEEVAVEGVFLLKSALLRQASDEN